MIWDIQGSPEGRCSVLVSYLANEIEGICGKEILLASDQLEEVASAIECFLKEKGADSPDERYLVVLAARALQSVGEERAARRLFVLGSGLVTPSEWEVTGGNAVWVVDLRQMTVDGQTALEMVFFTSLQIVLDAIAEVWDETDGRGTLGLKHVCQTASGLLGGGGRKGSLNAMAAEIVDMCEHKLERIGEVRGWKESPRILNLDLHG
jgi:hypothetical protein